jgi:uncharacterized protein (DUF983 family)
MSSSHAPERNDRRAAFTGLAVGVVVVFAILFATVKVTNASFAKHETAGEKAEATK